MRKKLFRVICVASVLTMAMAFTGCGSVSDSDKNENTKKETSVDKDNDSSSDKEFDTVEEYLNSDEVQSALETLKQSLEGSGMMVEVKAENNTLIYQYKYDNVAMADITDEAKQTLETGLEENKTTFESVAKSLLEETNAENPTVKISYITSDDQIIIEKEYTAQ